MEIVRYTRGTGDGPIQAYISFYIPQWGLYLNDMRLIRSKNGGSFLSAPSRKYEDENKETKYAPYFSFDKERSERFQKAAKNVIDEYVKKQMEQTHVSTDNDRDLPF